MANLDEICPLFAEGGLMEDTVTRGIGKEDFDLPSSESYPYAEAFTRQSPIDIRLDLTRAPNIWKTHQVVVNPRYFGDHACSLDNINLAVTNIGSKYRVLYLEPGTWEIGDDLTLASNIIVYPAPGCILNIAAGKTLTINNLSEPGFYQWISGTGTVTFGSGAVKEFYPEWWGNNTTPGTTDMTAEINAAFLAAESTLPTQSAQPDGAAGYSYGGIAVRFIDTNYAVSGLLEFRQHIWIIGNGKRNTVITSSYDGAIIRNKYTLGTDPYSNRSGGIQDIRIVGDRTKASQVGIDLLRCGHNFNLRRVQIDNSGGVGLHVRQSVGALIEGVDVNHCVSHGIWLNEGVVTWGGANSNLPTNAVTLLRCISTLNDGAGLKITSSNGNQILGGFYQSNYYSAGDNIGYNVELDGDGRGNVLDGIWLEGPVKAHLYCNKDGAGVVHPDYLINSTIISNGATGTVDRAVICNTGLLILENLQGNASPFKTIGGSQAPFQCNKTNNGKIYYKGPEHTGHGPGGLLLIEDENNNDANLNLYAQQEIINASVLSYYGQREYFAEHSNTALEFFKTDGAASTTWETQPWLRTSHLKRGLDFSDGTNAHDVNIYRGGANLLKTDDQFQAADGLRNKTKAGVPGDGDFTVVANGLIAIDTTNDHLYFRSGGAWKQVIPDA